jgi:AraC-like DNA-binding protein
MDFNLLPHIQVRLGGVTWHHWRKKILIDWPDARAAASYSPSTYVLWLMLDDGVHISELHLSGRVKKDWELSAKSVVLWPMNLPRRIATPFGGQWLSIRFEATLFDRINLCEMLQPPRVITLDETQWEFLHRCALQLLQLCHGDNPEKMDGSSLTAPSRQLYIPPQQGPIEHWTAQSLTQTIFGACWIASHPPSLEIAPQLVHQEIPSWLIVVLEKCEHEPFPNVNEMAHLSGFSVAQFRRLFQQWIGVSPHEHLHQRRMERARHLLEKSEFTIGDITQQMGFSSVSHFIRTFKSAYGSTPMRYRQIHHHPIL